MSGATFGAPNRPRQLAKMLRPSAVSARSGAMRFAERVMMALIRFLLALVLVTYNRYGFTFDEFEGFIRAKRVFAVLSSGRMAEPSDIDMFHGAAPDVIALALQKVIPQLSYDSRHLVFALFGVAGIYYVYRFGSKFVTECVPRGNADVVWIYVHQPQGHSLCHVAACRALLQPSRTNGAAYFQPSLG